MMVALSAHAATPPTRLTRLRDALDRDGNRDRIKSAIGVAGLHALLGYALISGLGVSVVHSVSDNLKSFDVIETPPPVPEPKPAQPEINRNAPKAQGAASPRNLTATPSPIVVPPPAVPLPLPSPVIAAPIAAQGIQANAGASNLVGPGTGSGGQGAGTGSGGAGNGAGAGGGVAISASRVSGRITGADYPRTAYEEHAGGTVFVRLTIGTDGRVSECAIDESSGRADLDALTCTLIQKRYRYRPARDAQGKKVPDVMHMAQVWETGERRPR